MPRATHSPGIITFNLYTNLQGRGGGKQELIKTKRLVQGRLISKQTEVCLCALSHCTLFPPTAGSVREKHALPDMESPHRIKKSQRGFPYYTVF
jgi:hypothetical protein